MRYTGGLSTQCGKKGIRDRKRNHLGQRAHRHALQRLESRAQVIRFTPYVVCLVPCCAVHMCTHGRVPLRERLGFDRNQTAGLHSNCGFTPVCESFRMRRCRCAGQAQQCTPISHAQERMVQRPKAYAPKAAPTHTRRPEGNCSENCCAACHRAERFATSWCCGAVQAAARPVPASLRDAWLGMHGAERPQRAVDAVVPHVAA